MAKVFDEWVDFVLEREGGLTNDPQDPGGLTNFGVDQRSHPNVDIRNLTRDQAVEIYRTAYWTGTKADQLSDAVAFVYGDIAVNQGAGAAAKLLQQALGVTADGNVGPATIAAAGKADQHALAAELTARRVLRYATTANVDRFGLGWMRRAVASFETAITL